MNNTEEEIENQNETPDSPQITVPHSREAEEAVIGSVLINPETFYDIAPFLRAGDFYINRHKRIWEAFTRLHEHRIPIDLLTLSEELNSVEQLADIGGAAYLTTLISQVPSSLNAGSYARIVEGHAIRRRMINVANTLASLAYNAKEDIDETLVQAQKAIYGIDEARRTRDINPISFLLSNVLDHIDMKSKMTENVQSVKSGFDDLDKLLGGFYGSDLVTVVGRAGQGTSSFLSSIAKHVGVIQGKTVMYFSLEMSSNDLIMRIVSQDTGLSLHRMKTGTLTDDEWKLFTQTLKKLADAHIFIDDTPAITPIQLKEKSRKVKIDVKIDLVIVDYLELMDSGNRDLSDRLQEISYLSRNLKILARELNVPVLVASHLPRMTDGQKTPNPTLIDLRDKGALEYDSDIILILNRTEDHEKDTVRPNITEIVVAKNRGGALGQVELVFRSDFGRFENVTGTTRYNGK